MNKYLLMASEFGMRDKVVFVGLAELLSFSSAHNIEDVLFDFFRAADIFVTPNKDINASGSTLSLVMSLGRAVVSTEYFAARELLTYRNTTDEPSRGKLVEIDSSKRMAFALRDLLENDEMRLRVAVEAFRFASKRLQWRHIAFDYICAVDGVQHGILSPIDS
jgi:glycosyltransferase involved in cell wall biosynthesis